MAFALPFLVTFAAITFCVLINAAAPPYGQLSVKGNKLYGSNGKQVQLIGMSLFWSQWNSAFWNSVTVQKLKCNWRVNVIRAPLGVESGGYLQYPAREKAKLITVIDAAIAAGIYVIIDWHYTSSKAYTSQAVALFTEMSKKYGKQPNILYEVWNEPVDNSWAGQLVPYHQTLIKAIRANDPNNVIVCGTPRYDMSLTEPANSPIKGQKNIMYTFHWYAADASNGGGNGGDDALLAMAKSAYNKGLPLFCTEYGLASGSGNKTINLPQAKKWWAWMDANKISHINWCIWDEPYNGNPIKKGTTSAQLHLDSVLSVNGKIVKGMIASKNAAPSGCSG
uniref:Cellulase domain-containing protein n=1 Tax=Globodera pallida TaxID=36090 RepID=A0A183BRA0_GLOPA